MIYLDSNMKKIVKDDFILISGKKILDYENESNVDLIKNKNLYFFPSVIKNTKIKQFKITMKGYVCYHYKKHTYDHYKYGILHTDNIMILNTICMKKPDQKIIDFFDYTSLDEFYVLYVPENKMEYAKLKLLDIGNSFDEY